MQKLLSAICICCLPVHGILAAEDHSPDLEPGQVVKSALEKIETLHLAHPTIDAKAARAWIAAFFGRLDPHKLYFFESDLEEFDEQAARLEESTRRGDFSFLRKIGERFQQRVAEATESALPIIAREPDFASDERFSLAYLSFPENATERSDRWRRRITAELLVEKLHGNTVPETQNLLQARHRRIADDTVALTDERLCQLALNALLKTIDPRSAYFSPTALESFSATMTVRRYSMGLEPEYRHGEFVIANVHSVWRTHIEPAELVGWSLIAVTTPDGDVVDLAGRDPEDIGPLLIFPSKPLGTEDEVVLELRHPETWRRKSISWQRVSKRELTAH